MSFDPRVYPEGFEDHPVWERCSFVKILEELLKQGNDEDYPNISRMIHMVIPAVMEDGFDMGVGGHVFNFLSKKYPDQMKRAYLMTSELPEFQELFGAILALDDDSVIEGDITDP